MKQRLHAWLFTPLGIPRLVLLVVLMLAMPFLLVLTPFKDAPFIVFFPLLVVYWCAVGALVLLIPAKPKGQ